VANHVHDPATREAIRTEYVYSVRPVTLRELAEKYNVPLRTLASWSAEEKWPQLRQIHLANLAEKVRAEMEAVTEKAAAAEKQNRERALQILKNVRNGLAEAFQIAAQQLLAKGGEMQPEDAEAIVARWKEMASKDVLRFLVQAPHALVAVIKAIELLSGQDTERTEFKKVPDIELSPEAEAEIDEAWRKLQEWRREHGGMA